MSFSATSAMRRRGRDIKSSSNMAMDMESIRARRAKLEDIINTMRPPPLTKGSASLSQPSLLRAGTSRGVAGAWPRRRHSSDTHRAFSDPLSVQPFPHVSTMTPYNPPLPGITKRREVPSESSSPAASRQSSGKRRTPVSSPSPISDKRPVTGKIRESETEPEEEDTNPEDLKYTQETLEEIVKGIGSNSRERRLKNTTRARKLLSLEDRPPIDDFLQAGILPPLIPHLQQEEDSTLQFEATWALTNLAAGTTENTKAVVDGGSVPILIGLLRSQTVSVKEQSAWALGNITGDGQEYRNHAVREGMVRPLLDTLKGTNGDPAPVSLVRVVAWVLSNIFRHKGLSMSGEELTACIASLKDLLTYEDLEVNVDALWAVGYIADQDDDRLQEVVAAGVVPTLIHHLACGEKQKVAPALRAVGNIVAGDDEQTNAVLDAGVLPLLGKLLKTERHNTKKEAAWTLSNITAGNRAQIQRVIDEGLVPDLIDVLNQTFLDVQREAAWALGNLTAGGSEEQVEALVEAGGVPAFLKVLAGGEASLITVALNSLYSILKNSNVTEKAKEQVVAGKGVERLEVMQQYVNPVICEKATQILESFFDEEDSLSQSEEEVAEDSDDEKSQGKEEE